MSKKVLLLAGLLVVACCITQPHKESQFQKEPVTVSQRSIISLDGEWELLTVKGDLDFKQTKKKAASWEKIQIPHYLWVDKDLHKAWYKCTFSGVKAPKTVLAFDSVNFKCIIYVNDQFVGEHTGGYLPFEVDITDYIQETNELFVGVEDVTAVLKEEAMPDFLDGPQDSILYPVGSGYHIFGIWQSVSIKTYPSVYVEDVFVKTFYRTKMIELEITITNQDKTQRMVKITNQVLNEFEFSEKEITLKASETKVVILTREWNTPVLWSPENPHLYYARTSLVENGTVVDTVDTRFGFREFWIENGKFFLNGISMNVRGSSKHLLGDPWTGDHKNDAEETVTRVKAVHSNALRLHANPYPEVFLDTADEQGVLIIDESALWCLSSQYDLGSDEFWKNAQEHIKTLTKRDRNHPSLVIWSVENEILLCGGDHENRCTSELIHLGDIIKQLDPTRPIMYEGDFDLPNADVINVHYPHEYPEWNVFPNEAYFLDKSATTDIYPHKQFLWDRKKPLYIGEFLWIPVFTPHPHAIFFGDKAFTDHELYRSKAKGEAWKMYIEAFRSQGVNGYCPWNVLEGGDYPTPLSEALDEVFQPFFGFIKEYSTHFFSGQGIERTIVVCNDTYERKEVTVTWSTQQESGESTLVLEPAEYTEVKIRVTAPYVEEIGSFEFSVSIVYDSEVYEIKEVYKVFPREKVTLQGKIALYDPVGETKKILDENKITYELVDTLSVSSEYDLLIIGYHALQKGDIPTVGDPLNLYFQGNILCFEQETLSPFGLSLTDHKASITFERTPVFNLDETDLRYWQDNNLVSKNDIAKPGSGTYLPLIDSGGSGGLEYVSLLDYYHEKGNIVFCQLLVTEKYNKEPMAHYLFQKVMEYALNTKWSPKTLGVIGPSEFLDSLNVEYEKAHDFAYDVIVVMENVDPEELQTFVYKGGVAWLHGLKPSRISEIIDVRFEPVTYMGLPVVVLEDGLTRGLSNQEFYWTEEGTRWWVPLSPDIAQYYISGTGTPLTDPCILLKVNYGKGVFIIDTIQWEHNSMQSARIVSVLLTNLGIHINPPGAILQAETMDIEDVYLGERGRHFYAFYTEGYLGASVNFVHSGVYTFRLYAWADMANNEGAVLELFIDKESVGKIEVTTAGVYTLECSVQKGVHEVGIAFINDYWDPPEEDRNLYVDKIEISYKQRRGISFLIC
ncbi:MAG: hypothetical protein AYK19_16650 [Theionarchaea archaeon DG-70-1]|nr:MAG: hypothetical protein AYK19_16650 [Theionarchaea archaeon DG-70-1]